MKTARIISITAAVPGFILLFAVNFLLWLITVAVLAEGILAFPLGLASGIGIISFAASDLSPFALAFAGLACISCALLLGIWLFRFSPYCVRLLNRYLHYIGRAEQ